MDDADEDGLDDSIASSPIYYYFADKKQGTFLRTFTFDGMHYV